MRNIIKVLRLAAGLSPSVREFKDLADRIEIRDFLLDKGKMKVNDLMRGKVPEVVSDFLTASVPELRDGILVEELLDLSLDPVDEVT